MALADLPDAVIARLRLQCPIFANRVAGTSEEAKASMQTDFAVPHAFFMPGGIEPAENIQMSDHDMDVTLRFRVMVAVDNTSDTRGQFGATGLYTAAAQVVAALRGWTPIGTDSNGAVIFDGLEDSFDSNRDRLWGTLSFTVASVISEF